MDDYIGWNSSITEETQNKLGAQFRNLHATVLRQFRALERISVAIHDPETDKLKTFVASNVGQDPLDHYEARLSDVPALQEIAANRAPRIVERVEVSARAGEHSRRIAQSGFQSSYTIPIYHNQSLFGFLFFNARIAGYFAPSVVHNLDVYADLLSMIVLNAFTPIRTLKAAVKTTRALSRHRDPETGAHLERMARYARVIARDLAPAAGLSDEFVEFMFHLTPLHDVGKIAVPDNILLKPGQLTEAETAIMRTHVAKGVEIIDMIVDEFSLDEIGHIDMLRNIVACHHENYDGSGYLNGLGGDAIPLEGRITRVADVFDALSSRRPYKAAWPVDEALRYLTEGAGTLFDTACVETLCRNRPAIEEIRNRFQEDPWG